jgi:hypothetical protein
MSRQLAAFALVAVCSGCGTAQLYDGPQRSADEVARISGDMAINAGSPMTIVLREVDNTPLNVGQNSVEVLPGKHRLLADCRIAETQSVSRHSIDAEVAAGRRYRLVGEAGPGLRECTEVTLQKVDF